MANWGPTNASHDADESFDGSNFANDPSPVRVTADTSAVLRKCAIFRFASVPPPQGSTINLATFRCSCFSTVYDDANLVVYGEDVDDCLDTTALADVYNTRYAARTTAFTNLIGDGQGTGELSIDVTEQVQEIVNRPGFVANNAIGIILAGNNDSAKAFRVENIATGPAPANLQIDYTAPSGGLLSPYFFQMMGG